MFQFTPFMLILWLTIFSVASPFLDVLEGLIDDKDEEEQTASDHGNSADDDNDSDELLRRCTSDADFSLSESDKDQKKMNIKVQLAVKWRKKTVTIQCLMMIFIN